MTKKHNFINAIKMHENYPETFEIPSSKDIKNIKSGDSVKIANNFERFWVRVTKFSKKSGFIEGIIDNKLINTEDYNYGNIIKFHIKNIYSIMKEDEII